MLQPQNITEYFIDNYIKNDDTAIDATCGNGNDTLKLCKAVGEKGKVYGFDIQKVALDNTKTVLNENGFSNFSLICDSHSQMDKYINEKVRAVVFNLGYLPGGDHTIHTKYDTTICAIEKSLNLICDNGFISITIYYGKNSGTEEKDEVMKYLKEIDHKKYTVTLHDFFNRPNNPPITAIITKNLL